MGVVAARILHPVVRDASPSRSEDMAVSFVPPPEVVDRVAWRRFCALVADGGGVDDRVERPAAAPAKASPAFFRKEVMRVDHHRRNMVPFLLEACALRGRCQVADTSRLPFASGLDAVVVCPHVGVPVEALLPYPKLAFRKADAVDRRAPHRG